MTNHNLKKSMFKQSGVYRLILLLMFIANGLFVSIEIYRNRIIEPLLGKSIISKASYVKIESLSTYSYWFEVAFIILALVSVFLVIAKKHTSLLKSYLFIQSIFLVSLFALNSVLSWFFDVVIGDTIRDLIGPFFLLLYMFIYFVVKRISGKFRGNQWISKSD